MEEGSGLVVSEPSPLIQLQLSGRLMLLGVASTALAGAGRGGGGSPLLGLETYLHYPVAYDGGGKLTCYESALSPLIQPN